MENTFLAPRQFKVVIYQFFGSLLLLFSFLMLIPTIVSLIDWSLGDFLIGSLFTAPPLLLGAAIIYTSQKYVIRVVIDLERSLLIIKKKGSTDEVHDLRKISRFVFTKSLFMPGFEQWRVLAETDDESLMTLFSDDIVCFGRQWTRFAEKLANVTDKPLKRESLIENLEGKLVERK